MRTETVMTCPECAGVGRIQNPWKISRESDSAGFVSCCCCFGLGTIVVIDEQASWTTDPSSSALP